MYKVIKDLAGFEIGQTIEQTTIDELNLTQETLDSWVEYKYIEATKTTATNKPTTDSSNANNSILNSK
jgi:hypothetical protein